MKALTLKRVGLILVKIDAKKYIFKGRTNDKIYDLRFFQGSVKPGNLILGTFLVSLIFSPFLRFMESGRMLCLPLDWKYDPAGYAFLL